MFTMLIMETNVVFEICIFLCTINTLNSDPKTKVI